MLCFGYKEQCNHTNVKCQRGARGSSERLGVKVMNSKEKLVCRSVCVSTGDVITRPRIWPLIAVCQLLGKHRVGR